jgi:hypothetical protein
LVLSPTGDNVAKKYCNEYKFTIATGRKNSYGIKKYHLIVEQVQIKRIACAMVEDILTLKMVEIAYEKNYGFLSWIGRSDLSFKSNRWIF